MRRLFPVLVLSVCAVAVGPASALVVKPDLVSNRDILDGGDAIDAMASLNVGGVRDISAGDGMSSGPQADAPFWTVNTFGVPASGFGIFGVKPDGLPPAGDDPLNFAIFAAGGFVGDSASHRGQSGYVFAPKTDNRVSDDEGGFAAAAKLNAVPLSGAALLLMIPLVALVVFGRRRLQN